MIDHNFRPVSLRVQERVAANGFVRRHTGHYSEEEVALPTDEDLSAGTDFFRSTHPRLPTRPRTATEWAGQLQTIYQEKFATGGMGMLYDHPELR